MSAQFIPGKTPVRLQEASFGQAEFDEAVDSLQSTQLVMGAKVRQFEEDWRTWLGVSSSVCVNSGTSALLLAMMWLRFHKATPERNEILIPAVTWSTSLFPAIVVGLRPVLVDVSLDNLCTNSFEPYITDKTLAVLPVHLMGHAADMRTILSEAKRHNLHVIEDACEAHGTELHGCKVGTWGDMSVFSFMFSHHMTTIEGGMINAGEQDLADTLRMFRAHGWIRETNPAFQRQIRAEYPDIHPSFLFAEIGLNVRPTEIVGAFGIHQLAKLNGFIDNRRAAFAKIIERLRRHERHLHLFPEMDGERLSPFAFPVLVRENAPFHASNLMSFLEENLIEIRPIEGANLAAHPFMRRYGHLLEIRGSLKNAELIHQNGFFFGLNQSTDDARISYIGDVFDKFFALETP